MYSVLNSMKLLQDLSMKQKEKEYLPYLFYEASIILILKLDKHTAKPTKMKICSNQIKKTQ